jgi:2-dehydro-3-deoxyglucarate aldolase/4-hydroxy-2-oxoheptanedioate aldolase
MIEEGPLAADVLRAGLEGAGLSMAWFAMGSVPVVEIAARQGFDALVIDLQHGLWDRMSAHIAVGAAGRVPVVMRAAANTVEAIGEALDSGAPGVLVPLVETAAQAQQAVAAACFPGVGRRSGGGVRPLSQGFAHYFERNVRPVVGVMIETVLGVTNVAAIAAVPGVDFIFIGTGDLALSIGCFPEIDARHEAACESVFAACQAAGRPCGIYTGSSEAARLRLGQGYVAVVAAADVDVLVDGFGRAAARAQTAGNG